MYYIYILRDKSEKLYVGYSSDLKRRIGQHLRKETITTSKMDEPKLIYYEAYETEELARERELKLKHYGSSYIGLLKRLKIK